VQKIKSTYTEITYVILVGRVSVTNTDVGFGLRFGGYGPLAVIPTLHNIS